MSNQSRENPRFGTFAPKFPKDDSDLKDDKLKQSRKRSWRRSMRAVTLRYSICCFLMPSVLPSHMGRRVKKALAVVQRTSATRLMVV
jgi:hypothetical protein